MDQCLRHLAGAGKIVNRPIHMNGRIYEPKLGRMLSPDPVTQAPENGQNYNRYTYAYNNPLKYSDPSGFFTQVVQGGGSLWPTPEGIVIGSALSWGLNKIFGGNGCDRTCKERKTAHNWCKAQSACLAELRANTREKFRKRSAQVILEATQTGQSYYYENGRAHLGDQTAPDGTTPVTSIQLIGRVTREVNTGEDNYHSYKITGLICNTSSQACNDELADRVFAHVNANDIPFTSDDLGDGVRELFGFNPIEHFEDVGNRTSVNITLEGHMFHPGDVTHRVYFENGNLYYQVIGTGTGPLPGFNIDVGIALFQTGVEYVVDNYGF